MGNAELETDVEDKDNVELYVPEEAVETSKPAGAVMTKLATRFEPVTVND
jgi:hypothetical protein